MAMTAITAAISLVVVWAMVAGVLSAYIVWCFRFQVDRRRIWAEAMRRAGIIPLMFVGIIVSQWLVNTIKTPVDRKSLVLGFIAAWLLPPIATLVWQLIAAPAAVATESAEIAGSPATRPVSTGSALIAVVASAVIGLGIWIILVLAGASPAWIGSTALLPTFVLFATLFVLTRRAERSVADHAARARHIGLLWSVGIGVMAIQIALVAETMNRLTPTIAIAATAMFLSATGYLFVLTRTGNPRR